MAKHSEPNRNKSYDPKKQHITETAITKSNWYKHVNWLNVVLIVGIPVYGMIQAYWVPLRLKTAIFAVAYYFMTGLGITAGTFDTKSELNAAKMLTEPRLPSFMGTHLIFSYVTTPDMASSCWRRSC